MHTDVWPRTKHSRKQPSDPVQHEASNAPQLSPTMRTPSQHKQLVLHPALCANNRTHPACPAHQLSPTMRPVSGSMSMSKKHGRVGRPGMVIMLPTRGYRKPAPTDARTSRIGSVKPLGAPAQDRQQQTGGTQPAGKGLDGCSGEGHSHQVSAYSSVSAVRIGCSGEKRGGKGPWAGHKACVHSPTRAPRGCESPCP